MNDFQTLWPISDSIWSDDLITEDDLEDETDGLWFDTWEGQIELTETKRHSIDYDLEDEFDTTEWRVYSPLNYIRKKSPGLLRTTSLQVTNQAQNNSFNHSAHTLFWNLSHDDDQDVRETLISRGLISTGRCSVSQIQGENC